MATSERRKLYQKVKRKERNIKKRKAQQAEKRQNRKPIPRLMQILPTDGFRWYVPGGGPSMPSGSAGRIVRTMRRYIDVNDKKSVSIQLTRMFRDACEVLKGDEIPESPAEFWDVAVAKIPWMAKLDGATLAAFALRILSTRAAVRPVVGYHLALGELDRAKEIWAQDSDLARAIAHYVNFLPFSHSLYLAERKDDDDDDDAGGADGPPPEESRVRSVIQDLYTPWWNNDPDNQGDEESTVAYKQLVGQLGNMGIDATTATAITSQPTGDDVEEEDEKEEEDDEDDYEDYEDDEDDEDDKDNEDEMDMDN